MLCMRRAGAWLHRRREYRAGQPRPFFEGTRRHDHAHTRHSARLLLESSAGPLPRVAVTRHLPWVNKLDANPQRFGDRRARFWRIWGWLDLCAPPPLSWVARASSLLLDGRAGDRPKRTKHAAVPSLGAEQRLAVAALVEELTSVGTHGFLPGKAAMRARQHRFEHDRHRRLNCARWTDSRRWS
jgi:hypothetical protein